MSAPTGLHCSALVLIGILALAALVLSAAGARAQQIELPEVNILTAVSNMAFSAVWVAEQLKYFEQEGSRAKITPAGGGVLGEHESKGLAKSS